MIVELKTEKLINNALALATYNNRRVLVSTALADEIIIAEIENAKKDYYTANTLKVIKPSAERVEAPCPYWGICGGCNLQHLSHKGQIESKEAIAKENFKRIGKIEINEIDTFSDENSYSYRNRVRFHVDYKKGEVGFLKQKSKELIPIEKCLILNDKLNELLNEKKEVVLKEAHNLKKNEISAIANEKEFTINQEPIAFNILGKNIWVNASLFFQQNRFLLEPMVNYVSGNVIGERIVELYGGVGTFSAFCEGNERFTVTVEWNKKASAMAKKNLSYTKFITDSVENWAKGVKPNSFDTVVVDPPRSGLSSEAIMAILKIKPRKIIYTSCDTVTLSRDSSLLLQGGYKLQNLSLFDLYPQTSHIEAVALMSKTET